MAFQSQDGRASQGRGRPAGTGAVRSEAVALVREALGYTQQQMASALACSLSAVSKMEQDRRLPGQRALLDRFFALAQTALRAEELERLLPGGAPSAPGEAPLVAPSTSSAKPGELASGQEPTSQASERDRGGSAEREQAQRRLAARLTGGISLDEKTRIELELSNLQRGFALRRQVLEGALTAREVGALQGVEERVTEERRQAGALLAIGEGGEWKFPLWQFDAGGPDGLVAGLLETLRALVGRNSLLNQAAFLLNPSPYLGGRTALQALRDGDVESVLGIARGVGAH